ncbi:hypothetical protein QJQ45_021295, partial [Haematococcus lacustris]
LVKAMVDKKRGVKANCANVQKAREVTAQRRAAEAAGPIEIGAQAGVIAAEAQAQADAGADEADAQLRQLQADLQHRELQLAHNLRMQQLQQQLQDLQRSYQQQPPPPRPFSMLSHKVGKPTSRRCGGSYGATSHFKSTHDSEGGVIKREWREQMLVHPELVGKVCGAVVLTDWANRHFAVPCHAQDTSASHRLRGHIMFRRYLVLDGVEEARGTPVIASFGAERATK